MNTHIKTLLSSSGIAKRNVSIPLLGTCKVSGNARVPQLINPVNQTFRPSNIQIIYVPVFTACLFLQSASRFDEDVLIQFP
jgi:hypothetical protein